ncbi:MAG TPA: hypothetical protein PKW32_13955 [Verrucomicrobiota bacterium]|nr:hypothetical protein [Verrucomicrobiota bacterium]
MDDENKRANKVTGANRRPASQFERAFGSVLKNKAQISFSTSKLHGTSVPGARTSIQEVTNRDEPIPIVESRHFHQTPELVPAAVNVADHDDAPEKAVELSVRNRHWPHQFIVFIAVAAHP